MFAPTPTGLDLKFRLFGTPVRVHPTFWLFSAVFGWEYERLGIGFLFLWIACTFVSILVHEFGHITMGRIFRRPGHVILYGFGGLAVGNYELPRRSQRIAISFAGPAAGLLLCGLVWLVNRYVYLPNQIRLDILTPRLSKILDKAVEMLLFMNLIWNLLNLIPIFPLDGGQISREVCSAISPGNGLRLSLRLSLLLAAGGAIYSLMVHFRFREGLPYPPIDPVFTAILLGLLALENFQLLQQIGRNPWDSGRH